MFFPLAKPRAAAIKATEAIAKCCPRKKRHKTTEPTGDTTNASTEKPAVSLLATFDRNCTKPYVVR